MVRFSLASLIALVHAAVFLGCSLQTEAKPHIILMVLDDVGRTDTGIYGESNIPMPRLRRIAEEGVIFENFYTQPVCSPTRSSALTGRFCFRFGMQHLMTVGTGMTGGVPLDTPLLSNLLAAEGYERHAIGKWHVGYATWEHTPTKRGFQSYTGYLQGEVDYYTHDIGFAQVNGISDIAGLDFWQNTRPYWEARGNYSLDIYQSALSKVIRDYAHRHNTVQKQQESPLFVYMAHQTVHIPIQYRKEEERCAHLKHTWRRRYCNMLVELDDAVGEMVDQLKSFDLWDNTLILTLTDNGGMVNYQPESDGAPGFPASQGSNWPLRGSKTTLFDGGVRSLGFAAGGFIPKEGRGRRVKELAHVVDFAATALSVAGVLPAKKERLKIDGQNLFGLISNAPGASAVRDHIPINIIQGGKRYSAVRFGKYKLIVDDYVNPAGQGWYDKNGDLIEARTPYTKGELWLFDLEEDPEERKNLAKEKPHLVKYAKDLIRSYVAGGEYMEPQGASKIHPKSWYGFHGGVWKPFMSVREWQYYWNKDKAKAARDARKYAEADDLFIPDDESGTTEDDEDLLNAFASEVSTA